MMPMIIRSRAIKYLMMEEERSTQKKKENGKKACVNHFCMPVSFETAQKFHQRPLGAELTAC